MLTLEYIREQIDSLRELKTDKQIQDKIQEIFFDLIYADQPFYVRMSGGAPDLSHLTLYIYSHQDMGGEEHSYTDILQMSVYALKNDVSKIILNEGDKWISIGIPEFLKIFFERIYYDPELFDYEFIKLTALGNGYKIENNAIIPCEGSKITVNDIKDIRADQINVSMPDYTCNVSRRKILKALEWKKPVSNWHFKEISEFNLFYQEDAVQQSNDEPVPAKKELRPHQKSKKRLSAKIIAILASIGLLVCIGIILAFFYLNHTKNFNQFCQSVERMDYNAAYVFYLDNNFGSKADKFLVSHLDKLIDAYAGNILDPRELEGALMGLENFETIKNELEVAKITAGELEASKNAYVEGCEESNAYRKLLAWENVTERDRANYAAVQDEIKSNQASLVTELDKSIAYYDTRAWDFASSRYAVMKYWFPENTTTLSWKQKYDAEGKPESRFCPIKISKIRIIQDDNGYWNLTVNWKNASVKPIKYICFSVTAIDSNGEYVISTDESGSWSIFDAVDANVYGAAEGPKDENYGWSDVFYGSEIADVKLTGVNITYSDNSSDTFTHPVDLSMLQNFVHGHDNLKKN